MSVSPLLANFPLELIGRDSPVRGGGVQLDLDIHLRAGLFARVGGHITSHPLVQVTSVDRENEKLSVAAQSGALATRYASVGLMYLIDIGRISPWVELGGGPMWMNTPAAAQDGQRGGKCRSNLGCDPGLTCQTSDNTCREQAFGAVHYGLGVDVRVTRRFGAGVFARYFALLRSPANYPIFLTFGARASIRL